MSNILWKKFNHCFSKFKCLSPPPPRLPPSENQNHPSPTKSIMIRKFNSIYDLTSNCTSVSRTDDFFFSSSADDDELSDDSHTTKFAPPDFATLFASQRFFFSSPGRSNSIIECSSTDTPPPESDTLVDGGVAFSKYSPDPYTDFRRSMQEMVEARDDQLLNVKDNLEYLHELLLCYLTLNPKHTHKYIISAFADLVVTLMSEKNRDDHRRSHVPRRFLLM